jgi:dTDP-4-dehydrorhamnose 3,5-epimerase
MPGQHLLETPLPGVKLIRHSVFEDERGVFIKPYNEEELRSVSVDLPVAEYFITRSAAGVLRGMHYQVGQSAHAKLVTCISGRILDVVVDVRPESPDFNRPYSIELAPSSGLSIYIEKGYAHGFYTLEADSWVSYLTTTGHCSDDDKGVLWSSIDFEWPIKTPRLSKRDHCHPSIGVEKCEFF